MKLSVNPSIIGKPNKDEINWGEVSTHWVNAEIDYENAFNLITVDGVATSAYLADNHRKEANFVSRELLMIDIDHGMTIPELFANDLYNNFGAGFYVTPSYTVENPRFRVLFRCETPITDPIVCRKVMRGLMYFLDQADPQCKDAARLFYGNPNCEIKERLDGELPNALIVQLVEMIDLIDAECVPKETIEYPEYSDVEKMIITKLLKRCFVGNYGLWTRIGFGMKTEGFTFEQFVDVTYGMMKEKTRKDAERVWSDGKTGEITMGTIVKFLNDNSPNWRSTMGVCKQQIAKQEKFIHEQKKMAEKIQQLQTELRRRNKNV